MKPKWLDRRIAKPGPFLTLCLSAEEFEAAMAQMNVRSAPDWVNPGSHATAHRLVHESGDIAVVVCLSSWHDRDPVEVAGMLVHESVHVWQWYANEMGERNPGTEQEAYAIQAIAQELMAEFARRMGVR